MMDGSGRIWGEENEKTWNGITAPRKMVLLEWLQMGLRFPLGSLRFPVLCSPSEDRKLGNPRWVG